MDRAPHADSTAAGGNLRDLVLTTGDWIWEMDATGRYTAASGKVEDAIGYRPEEVIGRTPLELMAPEEPRAWLRSLPE